MLYSLFAWLEPPDSPQFRGAVHGALEEASRQPVSVDDPIIDDLIATMTVLGVDGIVLKTWIYDTPHSLGFTPRDFILWAVRKRYVEKEPDATPESFVLP
jgi:hypothetical protein